MATSYARRIRRFVMKGTFVVLALGVSAGVLTGTTSWASGVSVSSDAQMMASQASTYPLAFDAALQNSVVALSASDPAAKEAATDFYSSYVTATQEYGTSLLAAAQLYSDSYASDPAAAKNTYVDNFAQARSTFFGKLETARNVVVSELSGTHDVAKDMFVNEYNQARDVYNNQLESVKNQIAAL